MYEYKCAVTKVVDGDTLWLQVDLGIDISVRLSVRLYGLNTPEMSTPEGPVAKQFVLDWLEASSNSLVLRTIKDRKEKYGRYLGIILDVGTGKSLNDALLEAGLAVPYYG